MPSLRGYELVDLPGPQAQAASGGDQPVDQAAVKEAQAVSPPPQGQGKKRGAAPLPFAQPIPWLSLVNWALAIEVKHRRCIERK